MRYLLAVLALCVVSWGVAVAQGKPLNPSDNVVSGSVDCNSQEPEAQRGCASALRAHSDFLMANDGAELRWLQKKLTQNQNQESIQNVIRNCAAETAVGGPPSPAALHGCMHRLLGP